MRWLITGGSGFVASHFIEYLLNKEEEVWATVRWNEDLSRINSFPTNSLLHTIPMELNDLGSCITTLQQSRPEAVSHLAAQSFVDESFIYPMQTIYTNTIGTLNLLEAIRIVMGECSDFDPVIHICSSSEVYGQVEGDEIPIKETQPFRPQNPYGASKVGADMISYVYFQCYHLKIIRTRMFTHTGPGRTMMSAESSFARQIARIEAGLQESIVKHGNLDSIRTFADVRDAVRAYYILVRKCTYGEVYNIGGNRTMKVGDMLDYLISLSPWSNVIQKQLDPSLLRKADVTLQIPDISKFVNETGWQPQIPFEKTMLDLLDFWRRRIKNECNR